mgnify:CR=1 FL=1
MKQLTTKQTELIKGGNAEGNGGIVIIDVESNLKTFTSDLGVVTVVIENNGLSWKTTL